MTAKKCGKKGFLAANANKRNWDRNCCHPQQKNLRRRFGLPLPDCCSGLGVPFGFAEN